MNANEIRDVMEVLEQIPQGGIGGDGPTILDLEAYVRENSSCYDDDSVYHTVQTAWRMLEAMCLELEDHER